MSFKYGSFAEKGTFRIDQPQTPRPWTNYITNGEYCAVVSQHGGGFSFYRDVRKHNLLRWDDRQLGRDCPGRFFYIVDEEHQFTWSPNHVPMNHPMEEYSCLHHPAYTELRTLNEGIEVRVRYFVAPDENHEIWWVMLRNRETRGRTLRLLAFSEWMMGNPYPQLIDREPAQLYNHVRYLEEDRVLLGTTTRWSPDPDASSFSRCWPMRLFMTSTQPPQSWESDGDVFFGPYRDYHSPQALEHARLGKHTLSGGRAIGAMDWSFELGGKSQYELACLVGVITYERIDDFSWDAIQSMQYVEQTFEQTLRATDRRTDSIQIQVPDKDLMQMMNSWIPHQIRINNLFDQPASYWDHGAGPSTTHSDVHHVLGLIGIDVERAQNRIRSFVESPTAGSDWQWLWLPRVLHACLRETGSGEFLRKPLQDGDLERGSPESLAEHLLDRLQTLVSRNGTELLPVIPTMVGSGSSGARKSIFWSAVLVDALKMSIEIGQWMDLADRVETLKDTHHDLIERINERGWDGGWYRREVGPDDLTVGGRDNEEGAIYLDVQCLCINFEIAGEDRAEKAMAAVDDRLDTRWGYRNLAPAYRPWNGRPNVPFQSIPGKGRNGSISHLETSWAARALLRMGRRNRAFELMRKFSPTHHARVEPDRYGLEPYVYADFVAGPDAVDFGEGHFSWLTPSASWVHHVLVRDILGIRPGWEVLSLQPQLPSNWEQVEVQRRLRGVEWNIGIQQESGGTGTIHEVRMNGETVDDRHIPYPDPESTSRAEVEVILE